MQPDTERTNGDQPAWPKVIPLPTALLLSLQSSSYLPWDALYISSPPQERLERISEERKGEG